MEDLSAKLSAILENPEEMEKIKNLAGSLLGGNAGDSPGSAAGGQENPPAAPASSDPAALLSGLLQNRGPQTPAPAPDPAAGLLNSISPKEIGAIMKIGNALKSQKPDDRSQLLLALKPHLSPARQERVEQAVKILRIMDILPLLKESGLDLFGNLL